MSIKQKTDLFRFVTLRAPQLVDETNKEIGFINHPNPTGSIFLTELTNLPNIDDAREYVSAMAIDFEMGGVILNSISDVKAINSEVWDFSNELAKKSGELKTKTDLTIPGGGLSNDNVINLWDNVFYSLVRRTNRQVRQACLQMIVADNYITGILVVDADIEEKIQYPKRIGDFPLAEKIGIYLKRLANAKVIIPAAFSLDKSDESSSVGSSEIIPSKYIPKENSAKRQITRHEIELAKIQKAKFTAIKQELLDIEEQYETDYSTAYDTAYSTYKTSMETTVINYLKANPADETAVESEEDKLPYDLVDDFEFSYPEILSDTYMTGKLSQTTIDYITDHKFKNKSIHTALEQINKSIRKSGQNSGKIAKSSKARAIIQGVPIEENIGLYDFSLSFHHGQDLIDEDTVYFLLTLDYPDAYFEDANFSLKIGADEFIVDENDIDSLNSKLGNICNSSSKYSTCSQKNKSSLTIFIPLYEKGNHSNLDLTSSTLYEFNGLFKLNNGVELKVYKKGNMCSTITTGVSKIISTPVELATIHYGLNNVAVADFRRVEQELCCYVPGEVSHIENVMAKEYKEKSSRSLIRSETTTEMTQEVEKENISDTTSTSRFEMSSEVAKVINQDRSSNLGFGVSTGGEIGKFSISTDAHGDFANAKSTSDSNVNAKIYAEDVTTRALERLTQRTSVSRTQTITREFEENTQHGFDNRAGEFHVTGVYRWIDKIYINRLVNYGKRLMYEFMIPEPAKFYKRAIIIDKEEKETNVVSAETVNSKETVQPEPLSISSFSDITRDNYADLASKYNAQVEIPTEEEKIISSSYSQNIGSSDQPQSFSYNDLIVPANYKCTKVKFSGSGYYGARIGKKAYIKIGIAGAQYNSNDKSGAGTHSINKSINTNSGSESLPVAVNTRKFHDYSITLSVTCTLQDNVFEQWQQDTYNSIKSAYGQLISNINTLQNFEDDAVQTMQEESEDNTVNRNPKFNDEIVLTEIKRLCIEMLTKPYNDLPQGVDYYVDEEKESCEGVPELSNLDEIRKYGSNVKFFEQAFDWELMAKKFYPYYWTDKCNWKKLFQATDGVDRNFQQFLQSGMARIIVPVKPGFETAAAFFMETGDIWNGTGMVIDTDDDLYLSIVDEMNVTEGVVEDEWKSVVPTSLNIVQQGAVKLDETGLPCCEPIEGLNINESLITLSPKTEV